MNKYWYEEGMCRALGYKGQYPVAYTSVTETTYKKNFMSCTAISDGRCRQSENCEVFLSAPAELKDSWELREKKM